MGKTSAFHGYIPIEENQKADFFKRNSKKYQGKTGNTNFY